MKIKPKIKKPDSTPKLVLEEIIGLTIKNANGLASNTSIGNCVYLAGCVVVVYNVDSGAQSHLMVTSRAPKPLSCVAVSHRDGRCIAAGESGHQPAVVVWEYSTRTLLSELKGHRFGVACIDFSPDGKHLVSVGFPHDGYLCLWDLWSGRLITKLKASTSCSAILSVSFSSDGNFFVTAGKKHLKLWSVGSSTRLRSNAGAGLLVIDGKPANLGCQKGNSFISVTSTPCIAPSLIGSDRSVDPYPIYALTDTGILCLLCPGFSISKWVDLKVDKGFALSVSDKLIACACSNGIVQLFAVDTLKYAGSLQYSEVNEHYRVSDMSHIKSSVNSSQHAVTLPNVIACQFSTSEKLVAVYEDHSLYVWDVNKVSRCCVLISHRECIWDVKNLSCKNMHDPALACVARGCCRGVSFATCSADGTIRLWEIGFLSDSEENVKSESATNQQFGTCLNTEQVSIIHLASTGIFEWDNVESGVGSQGFRSMAVSSDGKYLAAGDCDGNLHICNLTTSNYTCFQDAHDSEILSLSFSSPSKEHAINGKNLKNNYLLASGGRDRIIHVYDANRGFDLIRSLDDHSAAVTSVKLSYNGFKLLSCSADRSVLFRDVAITDAGCRISPCHHQTASCGTIYDMAIDPAQEVAVTVGQDKKISMFDLAAGKLIRSFKQDRDFGEPIKVTVDPSGTYLVCSYSNKSMSIYDFISGELVTQAVGHAEVITGVIFLPDCKHIISVGGDSCIFIWKVPPLMSSVMLQKTAERVCSLFPTRSCLSAIQGEDILHEEIGHQSNGKFSDTFVHWKSNQDVENVPVGEGEIEEGPTFKFSISRLPKWAQTKVVSKETLPGDLESISSQQVELEYCPFTMVGNCDAAAPIGTEVYTPCQVKVGESEVSHANLSQSSFGTGASRSSSINKENLSFAMDRRWHTIHTVYLDLLDSPEINELKDARVPVSVPNLLEDLQLEGPVSDERADRVLGGLTSTDHLSMLPLCGPKYEAVIDEKVSISSEQVISTITGNLFENEDRSGVHSGNDKDSSEQFCSEADAFSMLIIEDDESIDSQSQDDDLFSHHFSNLSTLPKLEGRRSSARRSYSARFVVRRDHLTGWKKLFQTPTQYFGNKEAFNCLEEAVPQISGDPSLQLPKELQLSGVCNQIENARGSPLSSCIPPQSDSTNSTMACHSANMNKIEDEEQRQGMPAEIEMHERIAECRAALLSLDTTVERALQLFTKLGFLVAREEVLGGPGTELSNLVAELLPSIMKKVQTLSDLVQPCKMGSSSNGRAETLDLEPLIGRFAEGLSHQVLELVKKNM